MQFALTPKPDWANQRSTRSFKAAIDPGESDGFPWTSFRI
jgi:hypothetical protein